MNKCSIEGCEKKAISRGWCAKHYTLWQRHGDPNYKKSFKKDELCIVPNCGRSQKAKDLCWTHYAKIRRSGTLDKINHTKEWGKKNGWARQTDLTRLDGHPDPKRRGYLATNTISELRQKARSRGIEWLLSPKEAYDLIIAPCNYCGHEPNWPTSRVGIDRVDNHKGYAADNCVPCCRVCNTAKAFMGLEEFIAWIKRVHAKLNIKME